MTRPTPFQRVAEMNDAFNNKRGDPDNIDFARVRNQSLNIADEYCELMKALGLDADALGELKKSLKQWTQPLYFDLHRANTIQVRDALCDIQVFAQGAQHFVGADGDNDMDDVVDGVMTRFIKDEADKQATIAKHAANGITQVYFEGEFPKMVMKSAVDQPDAPKGKFLKSASFVDTKFRPMPGSADCLRETSAELAKLSTAGRNFGHA